MTGRIEGILKDIHTAIVSSVDQWMNTHYIETLTKYPKATLRQRLLDNLKYILDRSQPDDFGYRVHDYLSYKRDRDGNWRKNPINYIEFAKELELQIDWDLRQSHATISRDDELDVTNMATAYGVALFADEAAQIAMLLRKESKDFEKSLREYIVGTYVADKDIHQVNQLMSRLMSKHALDYSVGDMRHDLKRLLANRIPFQPSIDDVVERVNALHQVDAIIGRLITLMQQHNVEIPELLYEPAYAIFINMEAIQNDPRGYMECIWDYYTRNYIPKENDMQQGPLNPQSSTGARSLIAQEVVRHLKDSAIAYNPVDVYEHNSNMVHAGICSPRGIELAVRARWGGSLREEERNRIWIEAIVMDLHRSANPHICEMGFRYERQIPTIVNRIAQYKFPGTSLFHLTQESVFQLITRIERTDEIYAYIAEINNTLPVDQRVTSFERDIVTEKLLAMWSQVELPPVINVANMRIWLKTTMPRPIDLSQSVTPVESTAITPIKMVKLDSNIYRSHGLDEEYVISREYGIHPTSEMPLQGTWVMRNYHTGEFIDSDKYRVDLIERHNIVI